MWILICVCVCVQELRTMHQSLVVSWVHELLAFIPWFRMSCNRALWIWCLWWGFLVQCFISPPERQGTRRESTETSTAPAKKKKKKKRQEEEKAFIILLSFNLVFILSLLTGWSWPGWSPQIRFPVNLNPPGRLHGPLDGSCWRGSILCITCIIWAGEVREDLLKLVEDDKKE